LAFCEGRDDPPAPAELLDLDADRFEIGRSPLHFPLLSPSAGTMRDETPVAPSGPLVVPSTTLLLLTSVERMIAIVVIAVPEVVLSLLIAETAATLVPSEVTPVVLVVQEVSPVVPLARGSVPVRVRRSRLVGPPVVVALHTTVVLHIQRLLDWR